MQTSTSNQQKSHRNIRRNQLDRFGKFLNTMPWSKRPDKPRHDFVITSPELTPRLHATSTRSKALHVNTIRINNDLLRRDATPFKVAALDIRDQKNTRRSVKVQSLVSLQQVEAADAVPIPAHQNFRAVVLEKQRSLRAVRRHNAGPAKPR